MQRYIGVALLIILLLIAVSPTGSPESAVQQTVAALWDIRTALYIIAGILTCICWDISVIAENAKKPEAPLSLAEQDEKKATDKRIKILLLVLAGILVLVIMVQNLPESTNPSISPFQD